MRKLKRVPIAITIFLFAIQGCTAQPSTRSLALPLVASVPLPGVNGRIDHLAIDKNNQIIFIAALGNNTVEVVDLKTNKVIHSIRHLSEPQGIAFIPESNVIFVANGNNGMCDIFKANDFLKITSIQLEGDADNIRYDSTNKRMYVGYGNGGIAIIDALTFKLLSDIKLEGHPESFQLDLSSKRMFVNVPDKQQIEVIDLEKKQVIYRWKPGEARSNFPMSVDPVNHRLFIGCRRPAKLLVLDEDSGKLLTSIETDNDADDVFYDHTTKNIYLSCGGGYVDVIKQLDANTYKLTGKVATRSGARTSLLVPQLNRLIVAAPKSFSNAAELLIYEIKN